jgi:hypothetical protein
VTGVDDLAFVVVDDGDFLVEVGFSGAADFAPDPHAPSSRAAIATVTTGRTRMILPRCAVGADTTNVRPIGEVAGT